MAYIVGNVPRFFQGYLRREWTRNLEDSYGEFIPCVIHAMRVQRGRSLQFQCLIVDGPGTGAGFLAPIQAFCWKEPDKPREPGDLIDMTYIQPWDVFSDTFGTEVFELHDRMRCLILPDRRPARYRFTIDFTGSSLAEMDVQHKHLHVVDLDDGSIGAFPNNRVLWVAPEWYDEPTTERPDFVALNYEAMAE
jgi:hypothetical protein